MDTKSLLDTVDKVGYVVLPGALEAHEVDSYATEISRLYSTDPGVAAKRRSDSDVMHLENLPAKGSIFESFFLNPKVLSLVDEILGPDVILKDAWSLGLPPYQDADIADDQLRRVFGNLHHEDSMPIPNTTLAIVTLYALVDISEQNGSTVVVPGSHKWGTSPTGSENVSLTSVEMKAGDCLLFSGALWHSSGVNRSEAVRPLMGACYARSWVKPFFDFTRALPSEVVERASPRALDLFGFSSAPPYRERWTTASDR